MLPRSIEISVIPNFYGGLNLADSPNSLNPTEALKLQNFVFGTSNMIEVRNGGTLDKEIVSGGTSVDGVFRYSDSTGTQHYNIGVSDGYFVTFGNVTTCHTLTGTATATAAWTAVCTDGKPSTWQQYESSLYHGNGTDNQICYNHTAWRNGFNLRRTGCPTPTATTANVGTTATTGTANGDVPAGTYRFMFTLELADGSVVVEGNSQTTAITESGLSAAGKIVIQITNPDGEGLRQTCNLYATDTDGVAAGPYYYLTAFSLTGTATAHSYTWDDYTVLDTGVEMDTDNYRPPIGSINRLFNNHMLIAGVSDHSNYIYISKFGRFEQFPGNVSGGDPVSSSYIVDCEDKVMGMEICSNGGMLVICENSVQLLTGYSSTNFSRTILSKGTTCAASRSVAASNDGKVFWMGRDDVYATDGNSLYKIGRKIWTELKDLNRTDYAYINGFCYNGKYNLCYPSAAGTAYCDRRLEFDTRYPVNDETGNMVVPGSWTGPHKGQTIACFTKSRKENETTAYYGQGRLSQIIRYDYGNDDVPESSSETANKAIEAVAHTGIMYVGAPLLTKRFHAVACETRPTSARPTVTVEIDNGDTTLPPLVISTKRSTQTWLGDDGTVDAWYTKYGPSGTNDVIRVTTATDNIYVARLKTGTGCASGTKKNWDDAMDWADGDKTLAGTDADRSGLDWLGYRTWRLPTTAEMAFIWANRASLTYDTGVYWTSTVIDASNSGTCDFNSGGIGSAANTAEYYVRVVRTAPTSFGHAAPPRWGPDDGTYTSTDYITWGRDDYEYWRSGLGQEATGDCVQMKIYCKCENSEGTADRQFALRNIGLMYSIMRRFWR